MYREIQLLNVTGPFSNRVLTITSDNGSEFALHEQISKVLTADFYFARPYASWERGLKKILMI
jgi:IS30 family transposase